MNKKRKPKVLKLVSTFDIINPTIILSFELSFRSIKIVKFEDRRWACVS